MQRGRNLASASGITGYHREKGEVLRACLDRFENDKAVLVFEDGGESVIVPRGLLPADCKEGDILLVSITVDKLETQKRRRRIERLQQDSK